MISTPRSHLQEVKSYFETPKYLSRRRFDIQIRAETVQEFTRGQRFLNALDIGCGDGSISLSLRPRCQRLTLIDISPTMLDLARRNIATDDSVQFLNENFMDLPLPEAAYDLVICLGVLAHVDSPDKAIARFSYLLKPGGTLIIEVTDSHHPIGRAIDAYHSLLAMVRPNTYELNLLRNDDVVRTCQKYGLQVSARFQYALPPPGSHRLFDQATLYKITRAVFGRSDRNRNAWLGNVFIYRLEKAGIT